MSRYARQESVYGEEGQQRILGSRVGVAGCGGIGVYAVTQLVQAGVTDLVLWDPDMPDIADLNTQFIYAAGDLRPKCVICAEWVLALNYTAMVDAHSEPLEGGNLDMFAGCGIVIDCLESADASGNLAAWCSENGALLMRARASGDSIVISSIMPGSGAPTDPTGSGPAVACHCAVAAGMLVFTVLDVLSGRKPACSGTLCMDLSSWSVSRDAA